MSVPDSSVPAEWTAANQRLLVAELARLTVSLSGEGDAQAAEAEVARARAAMPAPAAIDALTEALALTAFERDVLLLCAGVEMDARLGALCEASPYGGVTFGLALAALTDPHWSALTPARPLRRWRLVELDDARSVTRARLRVDERVLHHLGGVDYVDGRMHGLVSLASPAGAMPPTHEAVCATLRDAIAGAGTPSVVLSGDDPSGQADVAAAVCESLGLALYSARVEDLPTSPAELDAFATLWGRESVLLRAALLLVAGDEVVPRGVARLAASLPGLAFFAASQPPSLEREAIRATVKLPNALEQRALWREALGDAAARLDGDLDGLAGQFLLSARAIRDTGARLAPAVARSERPAATLAEACRALARTRLDELALRIDAAADWDDLVLAESQKTTLRRMIAQLRNRLRVHHDWGFGDRGTRGLGITALFAGDSGTGKTMAAEVLARQLDLDLYRIDLSSVVSKYIGETEKNLRRVFDAAEASGAVLLFDEADALFGKRSEVKDSHDRYANIEVSYLLQRMEAYRGLAILTTNLRAALDPAFLRRLRFVVHFPFPDEAAREAIWRRAFPPRAPTRGLDYARLARLNVTGGSIRNIAIDAAFAAAANDGEVTMGALLEAARHDAGKRERALTDAETRGWA